MHIAVYISCKLTSELELCTSFSIPFLVYCLESTLIIIGELATSAAFRKFCPVFSVSLISLIWYHKSEKCEYPPEFLELTAIGIICNSIFLLRTFNTRKDMVVIGMPTNQPRHLICYSLKAY